MGNDLLIETPLRKLNIYQVCYHICEHVFHPERDLKFVILDIIKEDGKSISAISRELEERGFELHRLILTGYLRAMTDLSVLREKQVPPSKVYTPIKGREKDIYEVVSEGARSIYGDEEKAGLLILYALGRLFRRPIFQEELARADLSGQMPGRQATKEERLEAKQILVKSGFKIPDSSKAYVLESATLEGDYCELLSRIVGSNWDLSYLVRETKQTKLTL